MGQSALDEALLLDRVSRGGVPTEDRTMIAAAAIYARKSTVQNVSDEEKSITRQVERARAYAARKGWTVADEHVFSDDGVSGGEFIKRPGLVRLISRLTPRAPFGVLIMAEESRLGREVIQTGWVLKQIIEAGVRVFFYLEDRERTLANAMDKVMLSLATSLF
jgi:DNA invertase Pin-like site-specific DNA recombinase